MVPYIMNYYPYIQILYSNGSKFYKKLTGHKKATIHQVTKMLDASKNVLFPGHNHLLTTGAYDLAL